ncbi:MAG: HNH endonuclease [Bacteroidota bacterium]
MAALEKFRDRFRKLNVNRQNGGAPHKPVLLLAVIDLYARGRIPGAQFSFSDELIETFYSIWSELVPETSPFSPTIINPIWRLRSDGFWRSVAIPGTQFITDRSGNVRSFGHYRETLAYIEIEAPLAVLLLQPESRVILQKTLLDRYFPDQSHAYQQLAAERRYTQLREWLAAEPDASTLLGRDPEKKTVRTDKTEEKYLRDSHFRRNVLYAYAATCCVSEMQVLHPRGILVDACHILPHAKFGKNDIRNGIALTPTLHRAFDQFAFTIGAQNLKVQLSRHLRENERSPYRLQQFAGKTIKPPHNSAYYPGKQYLQWHNDQFAIRER